MSIEFTTGWAKKEIRSTESWQKWVEKIQDGDRVIVQQFVPMGDYGNCFYSQVECWRFWKAKVKLSYDRPDVSNFTVFYDQELRSWRNNKQRGS